MKFLLKRTSVEDMAAEELYSAKVALLKAQTLLEYARSDVEYNTARIARLERYINEQSRKKE